MTKLVIGYAIKETEKIIYIFSDKNGLPLDLDMGGDLAELKKNLAKFKKGKHGKGLDDIDIEELDFVSKHFSYDSKGFRKRFACIVFLQLNYSLNTT